MRHSALRWVLVTEAAKTNHAGHFVHLDSDKLKHLRKVLRMEWDDEIYAIDGSGHVFKAKLEKAGDHGGLRLGEKIRTEPKPPETELVICLPKNSTMDWIVEKAAECGVTSVLPVVSSRSVVKPDLENAEKYVRRWQTIMDGAIEQSERLWRPKVYEPMAWKDWVSQPSSAMSFSFASELRNTLSEREAMHECWKKLSQAQAAPARILIGPEGGLSESERTELTSHGFSELSLGSAVLRVETAVIAALTLLRVSRLVPVS